MLVTDYILGEGLKDRDLHWQPHSRAIPVQAPLQDSYPSMLVGSSPLDFLLRRYCVFPYRTHGQRIPRKHAAKLFEQSHIPLVHPPPITSWFGCIIWPGWCNVLISPGTGPGDETAAVGEEYGSLGDCNGFTSGPTVIVSLLVGTSGFIFIGKGPGELGAWLYVSWGVSCCGC